MSALAYWDFHVYFSNHVSRAHQMKKSQGDVFQRRERIIEELKKRKRVSVFELVDIFQVSPVTVRRDLLFLEKKGIIERYYGGARLLSTSSLIAKKKHRKRDFPIKQLIKEIEPLLMTDTKIFVGSGIYSTHIIQALSEYQVFILTNDYLVFSSKIHLEHDATVLISGGELEKDTHSLVGNLASYSFIKTEADICLIEAAGFDLHEVTTATLNESYIYRTMMEHTRGPKIVYTPSNNLERVSNFMINYTRLFDHLYTDDLVTKELVDKYRQNHLNVTLLPLQNQ